MNNKFLYSYNKYITFLSIVKLDEDLTNMFSLNFFINDFHKEACDIFKREGLM